MTKPRIEVGSRVQYSAAFLRSTGIVTGDIPFARGVVTEIRYLGAGGPGLAVIDWDTPHVPTKILVTNLHIIGVPESC